MPEIEYRDATPADAGALAAIGRETFAITFGHLYHADDLAAFFAEHHTEVEAAALIADRDVGVRLVEADGIVGGYAVIAPTQLPHTDPARRTLELKRLYLLPALHGTGVGDVLIGWVLDRARAGGWQDIALSVFSGNPRGQAFYRRHGFGFAGATTFRVGSHIDDECIFVRAVS